MRSLGRQRGMTFTSIAFLIGIGIVALVIGMKLVPVYLEYNTVKTVFEEVAAEPGGVKKAQNDIWRSLQRRFNVNSIDTIKLEHVEIEKHATGARLNLAYEVRKPMLGNVDAVVVFKRSFELSP